MSRTENEKVFDELHALKREIDLEPPDLDGLEHAVQRLYEFRDQILSKVSDPEVRQKVTWGISRAVFMEAYRRAAPLDVCKQYLDLFADSGFGNEYFKWDYLEIYSVRCEEVGKNDEALSILKALNEEVVLRMKGPLSEKERLGVTHRLDRIKDKIHSLES